VTLIHCLLCLQLHLLARLFLVTIVTFVFTQFNMSSISQRTFTATSHQESAFIISIFLHESTCIELIISFASPRRTLISTTHHPLTLLVDVSILYYFQGTLCRLVSTLLVLFMSLPRRYLTRRCISFQGNIFDLMLNIMDILVLLWLLEWRCVKSPR
jgi:hypothetical protein